MEIIGSQVNNFNPALLKAVLDLSDDRGINCPSVRAQLAKFLALDIMSLPENFDQSTRITSIGNHTASVIVDSDASNGLYCCIAMSHVKDFGPPVHVHQNEDEYFLILDGHYIFQVGDDLIELKAGGLLLAPKGTAHGFRCLSDEGKTLVFTKPAGFEQYFSKVAQLSPEKFAEGIGKLNEEFAIKFVGKPIDPSVKFWEGADSQ